MIKLRPHQARALKSMETAQKGQIVVPTGGGKTFIMIQDCLANLDNNTTVIVAPRILLAQQLCDDFIQQLPDNCNIFHIHSGRTSYDSSTKPHEIEEWVNNNQGSKLLFTTANIRIVNPSFDECHLPPEYVP